MLKVECRYRAKLDLLCDILTFLENTDSIEVDEIITRLKRSEYFYRNQLAQLEDC